MVFYFVLKASKNWNVVTSKCMCPVRLIPRRSRDLSLWGACSLPAATEAGSSEKWQQPEQTVLSPPTLFVCFPYSCYMMGISPLI